MAAIEAVAAEGLAGRLERAGRGCPLVVVEAQATSPVWQREAGGARRCVGMSSWRGAAAAPLSALGSDGFDRELAAHALRERLAKGGLRVAGCGWIERPELGIFGLWAKAAFPSAGMFDPEPDGARHPALRALEGPLAIGPGQAIEIDRWCPSPGRPDAEGRLLRAQQVEEAEHFAAWLEARAIELASGLASGPGRGGSRRRI